MTSGSYEVRLTGPAVRALQRLEPKLADAVLRFLDGPLAENPMRTTKALGAELEGQRSGYVGIAYRVVVRVDEPARTVYVLRIAHRADVYRRMRACPLAPGQALSIDARAMRPSTTSKVAMVSVATPALMTCSCATTHREPKSTLVSMTHESSGFCSRGS